MGECSFRRKQGCICGEKHSVECGQRIVLIGGQKIIASNWDKSINCSIKLHSLRTLQQRNGGNKTRKTPNALFSMSDICVSLQFCMTRVMNKLNKIYLNVIFSVQVTYSLYHDLMYIKKILCLLLQAFRCMCSYGEPRR